MSMGMSTRMNTSWVEVDLGALKHNLSEVKTLVGESVRVMAVVKADAYGHGAVETAKAFADAGADYLGVTTLEEGIELRSAGLTLPILIFSPLLPDQVEYAVAADLDQTVCDLDAAKTISSAAQKIGKPARVHVKVDTGMGRLGVGAEDCPEFVYRLLILPNIEIVGTYTHFANAGSRDLTDARKQQAKFSALLDQLRSKEMPTGLCHAANSAATLSLPEARYDMVRPGTILYGQYPARSHGKTLGLRETWRLKTRIVALRKLPTGMPVGYGSEFVTKRPTLAAVIPIGYAEGFTVAPESLSRRSNTPLKLLAAKLLNRGSGPHVVINEGKAPVIGRVSMQMCSVDVTDIPGVRVGDEVIVPARRVTTSSRISRVYVG